MFLNSIATFAGPQEHGFRVCWEGDKNWVAVEKLAIPNLRELAFTAGIRMATEKVGGVFATIFENLEVGDKGGSDNLVDFEAGGAVHKGYGRAIGMFH